MVHRPWTESTRFSSQKIFFILDFLKKSYRKVPRLFGNQPTVQKFTVKPLDFEKYFQRDPWPRKFHEKALDASNSHIFPSTTPNLVILVPKFLGSHSISLFAFIIYMLVALIYWLCLPQVR
jgi:hypothetical protein